jgi:hypothetical protein
MGPIKNGDVVRDTITGATGTVTAYTQYYTGQDRCSIERLKDGEVCIEHFDVARLVKVADGQPLGPPIPVSLLNSPTPITVCKFRCIEAKNTPTADGEPCVEVTMTVVGGDTPENKAFFRFTPGGTLRFYSLKRDVFDMNGEYLVYFVAANPVIASPAPQPDHGIDAGPPSMPTAGDAIDDASGMPNPNTPVH